MCICNCFVGRFCTHINFSVKRADNSYNLIFLAQVKKCLSFKELKYVVGGKYLPDAPGLPDAFLDDIAKNSVDHQRPVILIYTVKSVAKGPVQAYEARAIRINRGQAKHSLSLHVHV